MINIIYKTEFKDEIVLHNIIKINCGKNDELENKLIYIINEKLREFVVGLGISDNRIKIVSDIIPINTIDYNELIKICNESDVIIVSDGITSINGIELIVENIMDYVGITCAISSKNILFRGQASAKWDLTPSIFRKNENIEKEAALYSDIKQWNNDLFSSDSYIRDLCNMQHYGIPTRLIDWTSNPLYALYFATVDKSAEDEKANIFIIKVNDIYDIDSKEYGMIDRYLTNRYVKTEDIELEFIKNLNSKNDKYYFIKTKYYNKRIKSQQGYFSIYIDITNEEVTSIKNKISQNITNEIIKHLKKENILITDERVNEVNQFKTIQEIILKRTFNHIKVNEIIDYCKSHLNFGGDTTKACQEISIILNKEYTEILESICVEKHDMNKIISNQGIIKIIIPAELKKSIINQLDIMGVNSRVIYPDEQGLAMYMREKYL